MAVRDTAVSGLYFARSGLQGLLDCYISIAALACIHNDLFATLAKDTGEWHHQSPRTMLDTLANFLNPSHPLLAAHSPAGGHHCEECCRQLLAQNAGHTGVVTHPG